jgi:hypothetical protein
MRTLFPSQSVPGITTICWQTRFVRLASAYEWLIELGKYPNIITDGSTRRFQSLILATVPYHCSRFLTLVAKAGN